MGMPLQGLDRGELYEDCAWLETLKVPDPDCAGSAVVSCRTKRTIIVEGHQADALLH